MMKKFKHVIDQHRPRGYKVRIQPMKVNHGLTTFQRLITIDSSLKEREALFIFLHECGHVHHRHLTKHGASTKWEDEYEADQYAIKAMRAAGIPIPRESLSDAKEVFRDFYVKEALDQGAIVPDHILKYAFGKNWRKHR